MSLFKSYMVLRDKRLEGSLPIPQYGFDVDGDTSLVQAFMYMMGAKPKSGKLKGLYILCHGSGTGATTDEAIWRGGEGLQLGREELKSGNVVIWSMVKDIFDSIVVYACGAAYSGLMAPDVMASNMAANKGFTSDGMTLMSALAKATNAVVFAADRVQWYKPRGMDFGEWEGTVYMFLPSGQAIPGRPPKEHNEVPASYRVYRRPPR